MQREAVVGSRYSDRENSTTDVNTQGLLTTVLQRMGKLEDTLAEARHMPSPSPIVGFGNYQEGHAHSQMSATPIDCDTQWRSQELYGGVSGRTGGCGRGLRPLEVQLGGMGERCKLPHRGLGRSPRSFATLSL